MLSLETLNLVAGLLSQVTLTPTADDFEEQARIVGKARRELLAAIDAAQPKAPKKAVHNGRSPRPSSA